MGEREELRKTVAIDRSIAYEGKLRLKWSDDLFGWHYRLSFLRWQSGRQTPCFTDWTRDGQLPCDEFCDRNLTRLAREAGEGAHALMSDEQSGQFALWHPPGFHSWTGA